MLTCLTVNPNESAVEILDEMEERLAQIAAISALAKASATDGYINDLNAHVMGAIETLAGQARLMQQAARAGCHAANGSGAVSIVGRARHGIGRAVAGAGR